MDVAINYIYTMDNDTKTTIFNIDRFEGGKAVLLGEHYEILVPKRLIPKTCHEGDVVHLTISSDEAETKRREKTAKELLNEILQSE